jgi:hypothetical protein
LPAARGDNREASNRVDRSHSMSMKMDANSNGRESLTGPYRIAAKPRYFAKAELPAYRLKN